jgi:hypothetical protein
MKKLQKKEKKVIYQLYHLANSKYNTEYLLQKSLVDQMNNNTDLFAGIRLVVGVCCLQGQGRLYEIENFDEKDWINNEIIMECGDCMIKIVRQIS